MTSVTGIFYRHTGCCGSPAPAPPSLNRRHPPGGSQAALSAPFGGCAAYDPARLLRLPLRGAAGFLRFAAVALVPLRARLSRSGSTTAENHFVTGDHVVSRPQPGGLAFFCSSPVPPCRRPLRWWAASFDAAHRRATLRVGFAPPLPGAPAAPAGAAPDSRRPRKLGAITIPTKLPGVLPCAPPVPAAPAGGSGEARGLPAGFAPTPSGRHPRYQNGSFPAPPTLYPKWSRFPFGSKADLDRFGWVVIKCGKIPLDNQSVLWYHI